MPSYFLLKTEPSTYSIDDLERDGKTAWDGVRNHLAKRHLQAMQAGDLALIYHSVDERRVVGLARVIGAARPDPTDASGKFVCVDLAFERRMQRPVTLAEFKAAGFDDFELVRMSRLSCMPVPAAIFDWVLAQECKTP
ncbi:MAG: EVE domain-containing protein [Candidatus Sericytochromatia bacterium]|nr:EVE domain-containing protein [Candidatus Sericytochromatia bacterium]